MRRIIFCILVMVVHSVTTESLRYRPQIPLADLHLRQIVRADDPPVREPAQDELSFEEESLEEMDQEEEMLMDEEPTTTTTTTTAAPKKEPLKKKTRVKKPLQRHRTRTTKITTTIKKKPICGEEPFSSLDTSCEQPTTCRPVNENLADQELDHDILTTCNTVRISSAYTEPKIEIITSKDALRGGLINPKINEGKERAQRPIRGEGWKKEKMEEQHTNIPTRRPMRKKKRRLPHHLNLHRGIPTKLRLHYSGELSSTSTFAPFPGGFHPTYDVTPFENYHCGKIAHCANREWGKESTPIPTTTTRSTTSTTEAIGRQGNEEDDYALSDYQFE